jgi:2'-deoxynucleoside 5'-phosphate N-hydrolase
MISSKLKYIPSCSLLGWESNEHVVQLPYHTILDVVKRVLVNVEVYFCGSIRGGRDDRPRYEAIVKHMQAAGCAVLTEHIARVTVTGEEAKDGMTDVEIYEKDMAWLRESECVVAEVTTPSLGVGYELGQAEAMGKPVLLLFMRSQDGKRLSAMLSGNKSFEVCEYAALPEALGRVDRFLARPCR